LVKGRYVLRDGNQIGFEVRSYDHTKHLVIDPVLSYSTYLGSNDLTFIWDINPAGAFVGVYHTSRNHGFLQPLDGSVPITIDPPNSVNATAVGINPGGTIVGQYTDASGHLHGWLAVPASNQ
jgi:hypothetical protein